MSKEELESASRYFGFDISKRNIRQQKILITVYHYGEGWIDEEGLERKLSDIFKKHKK